MNDEDKLREDRETARVNVQIAHEYNKKNPNDADSVRWKKEFIEAERLCVKKEQEDKFAGLSRCLYETDLNSIEEDIGDEACYSSIPISAFAKPPISIDPIQKMSLIFDPKAPKLSAKAKEFCALMRNRVLVVMAHYASDRDLSEGKTSSIKFRLNMLPDSRFLETWILPSHQPMSIPLYIIRHFGSMTTSKKISRYGCAERDRDDICNDASMKSDGFAYQQVLKMNGQDKYVQFVRMSTVKDAMKQFNTAV
jgi:hypothetical protein